MLKKYLSREWHRAIDAFQRLDRQVIVVLIACVLLVFLQMAIGSRSWFLRHFSTKLPTAWRTLASWGWWFTLQGFTGFVLPVALLRVVFKRKPREIGLSLGDWQFGFVVMLLYLPIVLVGTFILSALPDFQQVYPHYRLAAYRWDHFLIYEVLFLFYWIGWEYLWRGFLLFGTAHRFGLYAIFIQMIPFSLLHLNKPLVEAVLSIPGGLLLGALAWRCRSFWIAVPIHAFQMLFLDFWSTLRLRTGNNGLGIEDVIALLHALL